MPGMEAPIVTEIIFAKIAKEITPGIPGALNQFEATIEAEFKIKMFPKAARKDPAKHHWG